MFRLLLKFALVIASALTLIDLTGLILSNLQPPNPALRGFIEGCEDKPQPCWHSIIPAQTKTDEASAILTRLGYTVTELEMLSGSGLQIRAILPDRPNCLMSVGDAYKDTKVIYAFGVSLCDPVTLGEVITRFGIPQVANTPFMEGCNIQLVFAGRLIQVTIKNSVQLTSPVQFISMYSKGTSMAHLSVASWFGPIPIWKYKRLLGVMPSR